MLKLLTLPLSCFGQSAAARPCPPAFDELREALASPARLDAAFVALSRDGVLSIPMSVQTRQYLENRLDDSEGWSMHSGGQRFRDLRSEPIAATLKAFSEALVNRIKTSGSAPIALMAHECEVRATDTASAEKWHEDSAPNLLTCLATIRGAQTEYLSPAVAASHFQRERLFPERSIQIRPVEQSDIRCLPAGAIHVFATARLETDLPKLMHRAPPPQPGRAIFLARWRPLHPDSKAPSLPGPQSEAAASRPRLEGAPNSGLRREAEMRGMLKGP